VKVFDAPAQLSMSERLALFSLALGRRPERALEIGSFRGGSAQLLVHAMDLNNFGRLTMIEPHPQFPPGLWDSLAHRATLVQKTSPEAFDVIEGHFDFVFIDAVHTRENVRADLSAVAGRLIPNSIVLLHDVLHPAVRAGISEVLSEHADLINCGCLCRNPSWDDAGLRWAGLGMLRKVA